MAETRRLFCFSEESMSDPHAIQIDFEVGNFPRLTDEPREYVDIHGHRWMIRRAPCGAGCRCAAAATLVEYKPEVV